MEGFDIPVAIFIFKRAKAVDVVKRIGEVKPRKLYILADHGRNEEEKQRALNCRQLVEEAIDWDCEIIRNYAAENRGVYQNIGEGAKWVLQREKWAIFLEDDNLPEITFFEFCKQMLQKYEDDTRVLWVCGTNYLGEYAAPFGESYVFTRHMLPCGWASWSNKFERFYDGSLENVEDEMVMARIADAYCNKSVYKQYRKSWMQEYYRIKQGQRPLSWDYQMDFSIKANNLYGICPCRNQIKNIGVDNDSTHGGISFDMIMTKRFCGMSSYPLEFPLTHPTTVLPEKQFEKKIGNIILIPLSSRIYSSVRGAGSKFIRFLFRIPADSSLRDFFKSRYYDE